MRSVWEHSDNFGSMFNLHKEAKSPGDYKFSTATSETGRVLAHAQQWGAADAEIKVPSGKNAEL